MLPLERKRADGTPHGAASNPARRVIESEPGLLLVQDDPYRDDLLELPLADIAERRANQLSTMPSGLLSTFRREEILELLAYLESLRR
ncbi:MAG: hypothetical protein HOP15_12465 [Planctomycetes bacterium]|nr:hypothetical protein [Planctomycetota bacterium]